jgi:hypothetical protein
MAGKPIKNPCFSEELLIPVLLSTIFRPGVGDVFTSPPLHLGRSEVIPTRPSGGILVD